MRIKRQSLLLVVCLGFFALLVGSRYLVAFPTIPLPTSPNNNAVTDTVFWDAKISHPYVLKGSDGDVLVNFQVKGQALKSSERAPVNLVLVIDRSGSMSEEEKLEYAKEAAKRIISGLGSGDRIGIVAYSTEVELLYPIQYLNDKGRANAVVDSLYPTDSTNLSGGLSAGIDQLKSLKRDGYINRVILLSDGLANVGITDVGQLSRVASQAAENSIQITTMGLGLNYDENLMMSLAEYGAGHYYFIESPKQLAKIFEKEFGRILATVAKDSTMYLSLAPGVEIKEIYGYTHSIKGGRVQINLGDIFSGLERNILVKLSAPTDKLGKNQLLEAWFEFTDILKNNQAVSMQRVLEYESTNQKDKVVANENKDVIARGVSVDAASQMYQATFYYEKGDSDGALNNIKKALGRISALNSSPQRSMATLRQEDELRKAVDMFQAAPALESDLGKGMIKDYKAKAREQQK